MATSTNEWITAWENEQIKEQTRLKKMGEQTVGEVNQVFNFKVGMVKIYEQRYNKWQVKTLKRKKKCKLNF